MHIPTRAQHEQYLRDGYYVVSGMLAPAEVDNFRDHARAQLEAEAKSGAVMTKGDKEGKTDPAQDVGHRPRTTSTACSPATSAWSISPKTPSASRSISTATR